jgi:spore maturation protein CgeB
MQKILSNDALVKEMTASGWETIQERHTCAHRVDELYRICEELDEKNRTVQKPTTV